jgi:hypothetical protein
VNKLIERDRVGAEGVARVALQAVEKDELYALPHSQVLQFWRLKRLAPEWFATQGKRSLLAMCKRLGVKAEL